MPAWIESANPLLPWRAAQFASLPTPDLIAPAALSWREVAGDWMAISATTGGWAMLSSDERADLESFYGQRSDAVGSTLLVDGWRRGIIEIGNSTVVSDVDWAAAIDTSREHYGLVIVLNAGCNLACTYCYLGHGAPARSNDLNRDLAKAAILAALGRPEELVIIDFGEFAAASSLFYELATFAVEQGRTLGKKLRIAVQTNGTTLNDRMIDFLADRDAILGISIDGPSRMHDLARPLRAVWLSGPQPTAGAARDFLAHIGRS